MVTNLLPNNFCCILCGGSAYHVLYPSSRDSRSVDAATLCFSTGRASASHGQIVRCTICGLVCTWPRDDAKTLSTAYQSLDDPEYLSERNARMINAARHFRLVQRFKRPRGALLDIGCSVGFFLAQAAQQGWQVSGIEPSRWAVEVARKEYGLNSIYNGFLEEADLSDESIDVATMWDVLEHVDNPNATLSKISRSLKGGGILCLNMPNIESLTARIMRQRWVLLLREHLWYFSPRTIRTMLESAGLRTLSIAPNAVTFSLRAILTRWSQHDRTFAPRVRNMLDKYPYIGTQLLTFRMGEMTVVAEKATVPYRTE